MTFLFSAVATVYVAVRDMALAEGVLVGAVCQRDRYEATEKRLNKWCPSFMFWCCGGCLKKLSWFGFRAWILQVETQHEKETKRLDVWRTVNMHGSIDELFLFQMKHHYSYSTGGFYDLQDLQLAVFPPKKKKKQSMTEQAVLRFG